VVRAILAYTGIVAGPVDGPTLFAREDGTPGRVDRAADMLRRPLMDVCEDVLLVVRHHGLLQVAGRDVLAADHERDLEALVPHLLEAQLEAGALGTARRIVVDRFVAGGRGTEDRVAAHGPYLN